MIAQEASQYMFEGDQENPEDQMRPRLMRRGTVWLAGTQRTCLQKFRSKMRWLYRKMGLSHLTYVGMLVLYTLIGGMAFYAVEYNYASQKAREKYLNYLADREFSVRRLVKLIRNCSTADGPDVSVCKKVVTNILADYERSIDMPKISENTLWDFWYSVYFACTIYTTIGYGDIYCTSTVGRLLTMLYALIGIPILLTTLNDLGKTMFTCLLTLVHYSRVAKKFFKRICGIEPTGAKIDPKAVKIHMEQSVNLDESNKFQDESGSQEIPASQTIMSNENLVQTHEVVTELPVMVALLVTVGWIFACAALFCTWERKWTYFKSIYFFFISLTTDLWDVVLDLTTIGLGDVVPEHPKYMIIAYGLVIMGLALVSMSINVIQRKIEGLYYQLLQVILDEYHSNISSGKNQLNATIGMMRMWSSSPKAKFLVPLLSKNTKQNVAQKFKDEKESQGIMVPPVLKEFSPDTGLPKILHVATSEPHDELRAHKVSAFEVAATEALESAEVMESQRHGRVSFAEFEETPLQQKTSTISVPIYFGTSTQTDGPPFEEKSEKTFSTQVFDAFVQTQPLEPKGVYVEETSQTVGVETDNDETQTNISTVHNADAQTNLVTFTESSNQTKTVGVQDQELQTHLFTTAEQEMQCDTRNTKNERVQTTTVNETIDRDQQTDPQTRQPAIFEPPGSDDGVRPQPKKSRGHKRRVVRSVSAPFKHRRSVRKRGPVVKPQFLTIQPATSTSSLPYEVDEPLSPPTIHRHCSWADIAARLSESVADDSSRRSSNLSIRRLSLGRKGGAGGGGEGELGLSANRRSSTPELEWDPVDGMHAEKQLRVKTLKALFERQRAAKSGSDVENA